MKILIAANGDPESVRTWSGIPFHIVAALRKRNHQIVSLNLSKTEEPWYYDWFRRYYWRIQKKWFLKDVEKSILKQQARLIEKEIEVHKPQVLLLIHADFLAYATINIPCISIHDTTFNLLINYYNAFSNLTLRSINNGNLMYQKALNKLDYAVFSAKWASNDAINFYNVPAEKVKTIPLGANIIENPVEEDVNKWIQLRIENAICNLLFIGIDWERKGGPDSILFTKKLNEHGIKAKLIIIGCNPAISTEDLAFVEIVGFLNKSNSEDLKKLENYFQSASVFIMPSIAECYGCVFCEANAYGLPVIGRKTGGIPEIIKENRNGLMLDDDIVELVTKWLQIWGDKEYYRKLSLSSRKEYLDRLNYNVFIERLEELMNKLV